MCALPHSLPTLTKSLGDLFPRTPPGTAERDAFSFGRLEVAPERRRNSKYFEWIGI
jgi:hypothetical protein